MYFFRRSQKFTLIPKVVSIQRRRLNEREEEFCDNKKAKQKLSKNFGGQIRVETVFWEKRKRNWHRLCSLIIRLQIQFVSITYDTSTSESNSLSLLVSFSVFAPFHSLCYFSTTGLQTLFTHFRFLSVLFRNSKTQVFRLSQL